MIRILVLFTGGTIGSSVQGDFIQTDKNKKFRILDGYKEMGGQLDFVTLEPYTILSENLNGDYMNALVKCIQENSEGFDGVIVTHGTDTLQYTAAGLALAIYDVELPVVLVSSNFVLEDKRANGMVNFAAAVSYIVYIKNIQDRQLRMKYCGTFVSYANDKGDAEIHHGTMLLPHAAYDDKVFSVDDMVVGTVTDGVFTPNEAYDLADIKARILRAWGLICRSGGTCAHDIAYPKYSNILWLKEYPGRVYAFPSDDTRAVLLESYHSGTLCADNEYLRRFFVYCNEHNIPVFIVGIEERIQYESTRFMGDYNLKILPKISPVLAYVMLWGENK